MPACQEAITFPIRKPRSSKSKSGKSAEQTNRQDAEVISDEIIVLDNSCSEDITSINSPLGRCSRETLRQRRSSSKAQSAPHSSRRSSRKKCPISYREVSVSPLKKQFNVHHKRVCSPKKLTYTGDSSPERVCTSNPLNTSVQVTPQKSTSTTRVIARVSPRKRDHLVNYQETHSSPRRPPVKAHEGSIQDEHSIPSRKLMLGRDSSPEATCLTPACPGTPSRSLTPSRSSRRIKEQDQQTPTKRKILLPDAAEFVSPSKRLVVVLNGIPKEYSDQFPSLLSPSSKSHKPSLSSTSKEEQGTSLSPPAPGTSIPTTEESHITTTHSVVSVPQTPERTTQHSKGDVRSSPLSVVKRLNMSSPVKSPMKPLLLASPRRSPRKHNNENIASPLRNYSSPSSLVSRLTLASPPSCKKNLAMGLFKPNVSVYRSLRQSLNTGTPSTLVCREKQADEIRDFLTCHLTQGKPGSLYISGAPGTGKTASLNSNLESLGMKKVKKVFLNCMTLKTTAAIYKSIASELNLNVSSSEKENRLAIEKALTTSRQPILLMLDEVDQLDSKNQEVLYTIFEWPALPKSSLVMVGIANSLDLTDRILPRLQALPKLKPKLLHFPPYTKAEIVKIITHRIKEANLGNVQVIRPAAIQLLAGKVASIAGDIRKALDVCRRAVELCEGQARKQAILKPSNASPQKASKKPEDNPVPKMVEIPQILSIFNEVYGSRVVSAVTNAPESFPLQQKMLLCCLLLILKYARSKDVTLGKFHEVYTRVCKKQQVSGMDQTEFLSLCTLLESRGMLQVKRNKEIRSSKVLLLLNASEAEHVLGDRNLLATVLEDRESLGKLNSKLKS